MISHYRIGEDSKRDFATQLHLSHRVLQSDVDDAELSVSTPSNVDKSEDRLRRIFSESATRIHFNVLVEYYLKADFGEDAVKSVNTIPIAEH